MTHLWEFDHPYYSFQGHRHVSPAKGGNHEKFASWAEFAESSRSDDLDQNLLVRWDWLKPDPQWAEPGETDELALFYVLQRLGDYWSVAVEVTEDDEPAVREWLARRAHHLRQIWAPLLDESRVGGSVPSSSSAV
ncbi:hypothetical protein [Nocardia sp. NPDC050435]|uniref:hypothetical protein n=1 Tax=Nocardia sp. NPDC050435 TaxID=3155040 RepID=UPI0034119AA0